LEEEGKTSGSSPGGVDFDSSVQDDPAGALRDGLASGDEGKVLGAWRLLSHAGQQPDLGTTELFRLASILKGAGMLLDAARAFRQAAEKDLNGPHGAQGLFESACLLLGPVQKPEPGADMLMYLVGNYPDHDLVKRAEQILDKYESNDEEGLRRELAEEGAYPPGTEVTSAKVTRPDPVVRDGAFATLRRRLAFVVGTGVYRRASIAYKAILVVVLAVFVYAYFSHDSLRIIDDIHPALKSAPRQEAVEGIRPANLVHDGYNLVLLPRFEYEISGLIVSRDDYTMFGLSRSNIFQQDLCVMWGSNVGRGIHRVPGATFEHAGNTCYAKLPCGARFRSKELSNNHILLTDNDLESDFESLRRGDQIRIKGYLVDVMAQPVEGHPSGRAIRQRLKTSISRSDKGAGACEILHATGIEILARGNALSRVLYSVSSWMLLLLAVIALARLVLLPVGREI